MDNEKHIDESWKDAVANEKDCSDGCDAGCSCGDHGGEEDSGDFEVNFLTYLTSMGYQAMIFLGEVPHPATGKFEPNLKQAKFLIDTILLIREKTKGNLSAQEEQFLSGTVYELQLKYVDAAKKAGKGSEA